MLAMVEMTRLVVTRRRREGKALVPMEARPMAMRAAQEARMWRRTLRYQNWWRLV